MKTTDFIKLTLESGRNWLTTLMRDMKDKATVFPTPRGGNHPLWVAGHLCVSEANILSKFILGEGSPLPQWEPLFGMGSEPQADASKYPTLEEISTEWDRVRARTLQLVSSFSEADLDRPSKAPPEFKDVFGTIAQCLAAMCNHQTFHAGQVADARRAAGLKPIMG